MSCIHGHAGTAEVGLWRDSLAFQLSGLGLKFLFVLVGLFFKEEAETA